MNKMTFRCWLLFSVVASLGSVPAAQPPSSTHSYTLVSNNFAGIQSNMVEFTDIFSGDLSSVARPEEVTTAYERLMRLGHAIRHETQQTLGQLLPPKTKRLFINKVIIPWYNHAFPEDPNAAQRAKASIEAFYTTYQRVPVNHLIFAKHYAQHIEQATGRPFKPIKMGRIDKGLRELGLNRYSVMHDVAIAPKDFVQRGKLRPRRLAQQWINSIQPGIASTKPHLVAKNHMQVKSALLEDNGALAMLMTALFDLCILTHVAEKDLFEEVSRVREVFYSAPLGNPHKKVERLIGLYTRYDADIICLQEADESLVHALAQEGYFSKEADTHRYLANASRVLLKKDRWDEARTVSLTLQEHHLTPYLEAMGASSHKDAKKPTTIRLVREMLLGETKEVAIVKTFAQGEPEVPYIIVSGHADSKGKSSVPLLHAIHALIAEQPEAHRIKLLLAHDANTTHETSTKSKKISKLSVDTYLTHTKQLGYKTAWGDLPQAHQSTVKKRRSWLQTQPKKGMIWAKGRSDLIVVNQLEVLSKTRIAPGPNVQENPTDHAILVVKVQ